MSRRRRDDRLTSLWSFCARRAQCMSRDFTTATVAVGHTPHSINTNILVSQPHYKWDNAFSILRPCTAGINVSVMCNLSNEELQLDESFPDVISDSYTSYWQLNQHNCQSRNELPRWLNDKCCNISTKTRKYYEITFEASHHLQPRGRITFHDSIRHKDDVHAIEDTL